MVLPYHYIVHESAIQTFYIVQWAGGGSCRYPKCLCSIPPGVGGSLKSAVTHLGGSDCRRREKPHCGSRKPEGGAVVGNRRRVCSILGFKQS